MKHRHREAGREAQALRHVFSSGSAPLSPTPEYTTHHVEISIVMLTQEACSLCLANSARADNAMNLRAIGDGEDVGGKRQHPSLYVATMSFNPHLARSITAALSFSTIPVWTCLFALYLYTFSSLSISRHGQTTNFP